jgi:transmembrane protein DUF3566
VRPPPLRLTLRRFTPNAGPGLVDPAPLTGGPDVARRARTHRLDAIGVASVARAASFFYLGVLAALVLGIGAAWLLVSRLGAVSGFERFMQSMGFQEFRVLSGDVIVGASLIAAAVVTSWVVLSVAAAGLYNAIALPWGGVHVTLTALDEDDLPQRSGNGSDATGHNGSSNGNGNGNGNGSSRRRRWDLPNVSD